MLLELFFFRVKKLKRSMQLFFLIFFPPDSGQCGDLLGEFVVSFIYHTLFKKGTQKSLLSSSKKTTASLLLALFSKRGVCVLNALCFFVVFFFRDIIRLHASYSCALREKNERTVKTKKRKKRKNTDDKN